METVEGFNILTQSNKIPDELDYSYHGKDKIESEESKRSGELTVSSDEEMADDSQPPDEHPSRVSELVFNQNDNETETPIMLKSDDL